MMLLISIISSIKINTPIQNPDESMNGINSISTKFGN